MLVFQLPVSDLLLKQQPKKLVQWERSHHRAVYSDPHRRYFYVYMVAYGEIVRIRDFFKNLRFNQKNLNVKVVRHKIYFSISIIMRRKML